jgi:hypothetical protein
MLKPVVVAASLLCAYTHDANARPRGHYAHRAHAWCGTYLSRYFGMTDRHLALAREWTKVGSNARGTKHWSGRSVASPCWRYYRSNTSRRMDHTQRQ